MEENKTPKNRIANQTNLNFLDFKPPDQPNHPFATYTTAKGAIIAEIIPAKVQNVTVPEPIKAAATKVP